MRIFSITRPLRTTAVSPSIAFRSRTSTLTISRSGAAVQRRIEMAADRSIDRSIDRVTGCLVFVTSVLHADGDVVAVLWVVRHNVSHIDVRERMTTSTNGGLTYVLRESLQSRERAEKVVNVVVAPPTNK